MRKAVLAIFVDVVSKFYVDRAEAAGLADAKSGGLSVLHRFDSGLKSDVHWHLLFADGVWAPATPREKGTPGPLAFRRSAPLGEDDVPTALAAIQRRVWKLLRRRRILRDDHDEQGEAPDEFALAEPAMAALLKASLLGQSVVGPEGPKPSQERGPRPLVARRRSQNCAELVQFSLHANSRVGELARQGLEQMIRYLCRPALSARRVELLEDGAVVRLELKSSWRDGTTHLLIPAADFVLRLCALVPLPREATLHYHGVLAPGSSWRPQIVTHTARPRVKKLPPSLRTSEELADPPPKPPEPEQPAPVATGRPRMLWHQLMARVFRIDALKCDCCGGRRKLIAAIAEGPVATKILRHLGLPVTAEGSLPIRAPPWDDFGWAYGTTGTVDAVDEAPPEDLPFFDAEA